MPAAGASLTPARYEGTSGPPRLISPLTPPPCPRGLMFSGLLPNPAPVGLGVGLGVEIRRVAAISRVDGGLSGFDQGEIEVLPGMAEDFGDAAHTVAVALPDADLFRDDPAQIVAALLSPRALRQLGGVDAIKANLHLLALAGGAQCVGVMH